MWLCFLMLSRLFPLHRTSFDVLSDSSSPYYNWQEKWKPTCQRGKLASLWGVVESEGIKVASNFRDAIWSSCQSNSLKAMDGAGSRLSKPAVQNKCDSIQFKADCSSRPRLSAHYWIIHPPFGNPQLNKSLHVEAQSGTFNADGNSEEDWLLWKKVIVSIMLKKLKRRLKHNAKNGRNTGRVKWNDPKSCIITWSNLLILRNLNHMLKHKAWKSVQTASVRGTD